MHMLGPNVFFVGRPILAMLSSISSLVSVSVRACVRMLDSIHTCMVVLGEERSRWLLNIWEQSFVRKKDARYLEIYKKGSEYRAYVYEHCQKS